MKRKVFLGLTILLLALFAGCADSGGDDGPVDGDDSDGDESDGDDSDGDTTDDDDDFLSADTGNGGGNWADDDDDAADDDDDDDDDDDADREIAESDLFKVDGETIYTLHHARGLAVVDVSNPSNLHVIGRLRMAGTAQEMYVENGVATILLTGIYQQEEGSDRVRRASKIVTVDVSDPANPVLIEEFFISGTMVDNRRVGKIVYVVSSSSYWWDYCDGESTNEGSVEIKSFDVSNPNAVSEVDSITMDGEGYAVYVSQKALYVADRRYRWYDEEENDSNKVRYIDISDPDGAMTQRGEFNVTGAVLDRFKMHEAENVFAVVSVDYENNDTTLLETFDISNPDDISRLGQVTVIDDEELHASNFDGTRAYIVTYYQTDPLFVVDFADAANPTVLGELIIPGWSTHLEIRGMKLFGVGIDDTDHWKTKVGYFDVTDPTQPTELASVSLGEGYSWSEANRDWKAFKVYDELGLILVPTQEYSSSWYSYVHKLNLIDFDETTLTARGSIVSDTEVKRGFVAGDHLGLLSETHLQLVDYTDRDNPSVLGSTRIASYVDSISRCQNMLCNTNEFYSDFAYRLRLFDPQNLSDEPSWESDVLDNNLNGWYRSQAQIVNHGSKVYLVENNYYYDWEDDWGKANREEGPYRLVHAFDLDDTGAPEYLGSGEMPVDEESYWYGLNQAETLTDNGLMAATETRYNYDDEDYEQITSLNLYDLSDLGSIEANSVEVGLRPLMSDDQFNKPIIRGNHVWIPTCEPVENSNEDRPLLRCFAVQVDASDPDNVSREAKVNIPGQLIGVNETEDRLFALNRVFGEEVVHEYGDWQSTYLSCIYKLEILSVEDGQASRVQTHELFNDPYCYYLDEEYFGDDDDDDDDDYVDDDDDDIPEVDPTTDDDDDDDDDRKARVRKIRKDGEGEWRTERPTVHVEGNTLVAVTIQYNYTADAWDDDTCSYDPSQRYRSVIALFDGTSGDAIAEETIPGSYSATKVDGGGVLAQSYSYSNSYDGAEYSYTYIDVDGSKEEFTLPGSNGGYWWSYADYGVRIDNTLYIPMGWEGIYAHELGQ